MRGAMPPCGLGELLFEERKDGVKPEVCVGNWVKVGRNKERFWCRVVRWREDGAILANVGNDLVLNHTLSCGDQIVLKHSHVLEVATLADQLTFRRLVAASGDPIAAALAWHALRSNEASA